MKSVSFISLLLGSVLTILCAAHPGFSQTAGTLDVSFHSTGTLVTDNGYLDLYQDVEVQPDGKIVAAGTFYDAIWSASIQVVRLLENGSNDPSFGDNGVFTYHKNYETGAYACHIKENGKILVAGITTDDLGAFAMIVLQMDPDGVLDPSFGTSGVSYIDLGPGEDIAYAMTVQQDNKILLAGYSANANYLNVPVVVRLNPDGSLDNSFGINGVATVPVTETDNDFSCLDLQSDGKIVAAGHISNGLNWFSLLAARFDTSGVLDATYANEGILNLNLNNVDDEFFGMKIQEDDRAVLTGFTTMSNTLDFHFLAMRLTNEGLADPTFGTDGVVVMDQNPYMVGNAMVIQPDGKILIAGTSGEKMPMNNDWCLWRLNQDGTPDLSFGNQGNVLTEFFGEADEARALALTGDRIVVAGKARNVSQNFDFAIARYINDIGVSIPGYAANPGLEIYPNPIYVTKTLHLRKPDNSPVTQVNMSFFDGKIVPVRYSDGEKEWMNLELPADLAPGVYLLQVSSETANYSCKIVVLN